MIWWMIAAVLAFFVKGLCGFANTLVFTTVLTFGADNINISPVELLSGYPTNAILAWRERSCLKWKIWLPLAALVLVGNVPGILFLKNADNGLIKIIFGFVIILVGLEMLVRERRLRKKKESKAVLILIGILSGILCGLYGVGALLGAYVGRVTEDSHSFKANICMVFLVENTFRIILYTVWGILNVSVLKKAAVLLPFTLAGLLLGMYAGRIMNEKTVRRLVTWMLIVSGAALIVMNL